MAYPWQVLKETSAPEHGWWLPAPDDVSEDEEAYIASCRANSLIACARELETTQREVHQQYLSAAALYSNRELAAFDWGNGQLHRASLAPLVQTGENITVRVVDTLVSQLGKNRPKPKPVARGASFHLRQAIKKLDKFLYGEFQRNSVYTVGKQIFRDACIFGLGAAEICMEEDDGSARTVIKRVFPDELLIDQMEVVATGQIQTLYRRRVLPVEVVAAEYDIDVEELAMESAKVTYLDHRPVGAGYCVVVKGWQRNGRTMTAVAGRILEEAEWDHDWFPMVFYQWQEPVSGFFSASVVEQVLPYQIRLNEINEVIRDAQDLMGRPRILIAEGSKVNPLEVDNVIGRFIKYTGIKPEAITWQAINAELYNERDRLVITCLEHFGLSQLATTVTPPPGARFDSSAAFREFNSIQDDRLSDPAQRLEEFYLNLAHRMIDVIRASGTKPKTVWYSGWKHARAEEIDWEELDLDDNAYVMSLEATSLYSMSPSAARDELEKQLATGLISPEQYRAELSSPDMDGMYTLQAAAADDLSRVQDILETGEYENPIPEQDLVSGVTQMTLAMLQLRKYKDVPAETTLNFANWIAAAKAILNRGVEEPEGLTADQDPMAMMDPMAGMMPPGGPMPGMGPGQMGPDTLPVPEAFGLAPAGPGAMPNI